LGLHPRLVELSTLRFDETVAGLPPVATDETMLIVVGRGSSDPAAAAETRAFAALRGTASRIADVATAFVALCEPRLDDVLRSAAASRSIRRVVVQPHLLFRGEMLQTIADRVAAIRTARPDIDWRISSHLGVHPLLVEAIVARSSV
jgi:sirohydrochlorin ferrochelatase